MSQKQTIWIHEAYRIARNMGYKRDQPLSYYKIVAIVSEAYQQGYRAQERDKKEL